MMVPMASKDIEKKKLVIEMQNKAKQHKKTYAGMLYSECFKGLIYSVEGISKTAKEEHSFDWNYILGDKKYLFRITNTGENEVTVKVLLFAGEDLLIAAKKVVTYEEAPFVFTNGLDTFIQSNINSIYEGLLGKIKEKGALFKEEKKNEPKDLVERINHLYKQ